MVIAVSETNIKVFFITALLVTAVIGFMLEESGKGAQQSFDLENAYQRGCAVLTTTYGCNNVTAVLKNIKISGFSLNGSDASMYDICIEKFSGDDEYKLMACRKTCGCPG